MPTLACTAIISASFIESDGEPITNAQPISKLSVSSHRIGASLISTLRLSCLHVCNDKQSYRASSALRRQLVASRALKSGQLRFLSLSIRSGKLFVQGCVPINTETLCIYDDVTACAIYSGPHCGNIARRSAKFALPGRNISHRLNNDVHVEKVWRMKGKKSLS
ncbi:PREDICTED: uncharacterized protein LOC106750555 [Dinoponera quadriceps]|uniref:Uncharacterized protein LOC106750555 n=1 Tax=Dinoponera quadriceps TaxID=609295 RepID=A0A6P3Y6G1_DINQU|nr:PREDICTED: uncharacterized protein LOC106750555 [Dinoponera quadriceps]